MGAATSRLLVNPRLKDVKKQQLVMDNSEVTVVRYCPNNMQAPGGEPVSRDFLQKNAYFVMPQMKELQKQKTMLKKTVKDGDQVYAKFRIVNGGTDIKQSSNIYYVANR